MSQINTSQKSTTVVFTRIEVPEGVDILCVREHFREGGALSGGQPCLLGDVLGFGVVDVEVQVAAVQVSRVHDRLAGVELLQIRAHVGFPGAENRRNSCTIISSYPTSTHKNCSPISNTRSLPLIKSVVQTHQSLARVGHVAGHEDEVVELHSDGASLSVEALALVLKVIAHLQHLRESRQTNFVHRVVALAEL